MTPAGQPDDHSPPTPPTGDPTSPRARAGSRRPPAPDLVDERPGIHVLLRVQARLKRLP